MSDPKDHHFVPAFHIASWKGSDDQVCQMRRIGGSVKPLRRAPSATGFERHLYRTEGVPPEHEQHLERNFFSPVDNDASQALDLMLSGSSERWSSEVRSAWTRYILGLLFRAPQTVKDMKAHMLDLWEAARDSIKDDYSNRRLPTDPETFAKFEANLDPTQSGVRATNMIMRMIDNDRVAPGIFKMQWSLHRVENARLPLLLSDRPLDWPFGLSRPDAHIALPIAPHLIFLAANDPTLKDADLWRSETKVVRTLNKVVVGQAKEYVWGTDERQLEFVRKHMGTIPMRPAITEAQKAASLGAVRRQTGDNKER